MPESQTLKKEERIYLRSELNELFASRGSFVCYPFRVVYLEVPRQELPLKMMVSVPKRRLKHAVDRNRIKRLTREAYRLTKKELVEQIDPEVTLLIGFIYLKDRLSRYSTVQQAVEEAFKKLQPHTKEPVEDD
ncbi:ribonuclease P protein component [Porphyromonas sp. CAG:1061]|uniref:ribonuclease P protein component n=1 Tax=Porphyromonas sp. CAG:1061 TaxID=1262916 RepID=UPI0003384B8A|nr:ribonuclease P protein component [Porphyromonas sp. CAG:1061]CCY09371.1 ribonuclease P protein component [Porphyromonas sp. CAG:1061]